MCDLEQRIDVVKVYLPEPEDVDWFGMKSREVDGCLSQTKQEVVIIIEYLVKRLLVVLARTIVLVIVVYVRVF